MKRENGRGSVSIEQCTPETRSGPEVQTSTHTHWSSSIHTILQFGVHGWRHEKPKKEKSEGVKLQDNTATEETARVQPDGATFEDDDEESKRIKGVCVCVRSCVFKKERG